MYELNNDPNYQEYLKLEEKGELKQYAGQYVAFCRGEFLTNDPDEKSLLGKVRDLCKEEGAFIHKVLKEGEVESVIPLPMSIYKIIN